MGIWFRFSDPRHMAQGQGTLNPSPSMPQVVFCVSFGLCLFYVPSVSSVLCVSSMSAPKSSPSTPQVVDSRFGIGISEDIGTWQRTRLEEVGVWVGSL